MDTSCLVTQGAIVVWATGKSGTSTRTVQATFRRRSFIDYLYFTDYETTDPAAYPVGSFNANNSAWAQDNCAQHWYEGRPGGPPYDNNHCVDINFSSGDVINGPLHSNDAILVCGNPTFNGNVTTSWQGAGTPVKRYRTNSGCSNNNPTFARAGDPKYADPLTMPPSNLSMKSSADATLAGAGCLFTGPTSITLNSTGTMTVVSPFTKWPAAPNNCQPGTNIPLPSNGVIYVQNVPASSSDPNYTASCITSTQLGGTATVQHPLGYPQKYDISQYGCMNGDVFLKGTLKGRLSIAADNNIDIIGNVTYQGGTGGSDLLGLVANNYVEIYHPVGDCGSGSSPCDNGSKNNGYYNLDDVPGGLTIVLQQPHHPGGDAVGEPLVPGAELPVRGRHAARDDHGLRRDRAEVPRHGGHERVVRVHEELHLRPAHEVPVAAVLPEPRRGGVADRHLDRVQGIELRQRPHDVPVMPGSRNPA